MGSRKDVRKGGIYSLEKLQSRHADCDESIKAELRRPIPDNLLITRFKKLKLLYKQQIDAMQSAAILMAQKADKSVAVPGPIPQDVVDESDDFPECGDVISFQAPRPRSVYQEEPQRMLATG